MSISSHPRQGLVDRLMPTGVNAAASICRLPLSGTLCALWALAMPTWSYADGLQGLQSLKGRWAEAGITPVLVYDGELLANLGGGVQRGATLIDTFHVQVQIDGQKLLGADGLTAFLDALALRDGRAAGLLGDVQGASNIAGTSGNRIYEAWLQYNAAGSRQSLLAGVYDLNSEFYRLQSAALFLNSSFGIGPEFAQSGTGGPSIYPDTSLGLRWAFKRTANSVFRMAVLEGAPIRRPDGSWRVFADGAGYLVTVEAAYLSRPGASQAPGTSRSRIGRASSLSAYASKVAIGAWYYTAHFDDLSARNVNGLPTQRSGSAGAYLILDGPLERSTSVSGARVTGFLQAGLGDSRVNRLGTYVGAGVVRHGTLGGRPDDEIGLSIAAAMNGSHYLHAQRQLAVPTERSEVVVELTYLAQFSHSVALQPDVQYIVHPDTNPAYRNAWGFQLALECQF